LCSPCLARYTIARGKHREILQDIGKSSDLELLAQKIKVRNDKWDCMKLKTSMNLIKVHYMHIWKCHDKNPLLLIHANKNHEK
jgi:hypothetical protein